MAPTNTSHPVISILVGTCHRAVVDIVPAVDSGSASPPQLLLLLVLLVFRSACVVFGWPVLAQGATIVPASTIPLRSICSTLRGSSRGSCTDGQKTPSFQVGE